MVVCLSVFRDLESGDRKWMGGSMGRLMLLLLLCKSLGTVLLIIRREDCKNEANISKEFV